MTEAPTRAVRSRFSGYWQTSKTNFPGLLVAATIAVASQFVSEHYGGPAILFALLLGIAFNFLSDEGGRTAPGVNYASKGLLRIAVGLLGAQITFSQILALGPTPVVTVIVGVLLTIGFGVLAAQLLGFDRQFGLLTAGAVAICGASAALAISTVLPRHENHERDTIFTVVAVTGLSTTAMVLYPIIIGFFHLDYQGTGMFLGGTIHDVAQVVGAGYSVSEKTGNVATFTKLLRVAMLLPVVFALTYFFRGRAEKGAAKGTFPSFLLVFAVLVVLNSMGVIPVPVLEAIKTVSRWFLITAIAALGIRTSLRQMASVGGKAIGLMVAETLFLAGFVLIVVLTTGF